MELEQIVTAAHRDLSSCVHRPILMHPDRTPKNYSRSDVYFTGENHPPKIVGVDRYFQACGACCIMRIIRDSETAGIADSVSGIAYDPLTVL